jgi:hypothetical protein
MVKKRAKPKGWRKEPARHALSAKGIKTSQKRQKGGIKSVSTDNLLLRAKWLDRTIKEGGTLLGPEATERFIIILNGVVDELDRRGIEFEGYEGTSFDKR